MRDASEKPSELVNDVCDKLRQILKSFQCRVTFGNLSLGERYLKNELCLLVVFKIRGVVEQYIACFERALPCVAECSGNPGNDAPVRCNGLDGMAESGPNGEQQAVLVDIVQFVEHPEMMTEATLVRLDTVDRFYISRPKALYLSKLFGTIFRGGIVDREHDGRFFTVPSARSIVA